jgi:hypothetical protein
MFRVGTREQVMNKEAIMTSGGLKKKDLKYNNSGKIVSNKMSTNAKKKFLQKTGNYNKMNGGTKSEEEQKQKLSHHIINDKYINKKLLQKEIEEIHSNIETILDKIPNNNGKYKLMYMLHKVWIQDIYNKRPYNCYDCYIKLIRNQLLLDKKDQEKYFNLINKLINKLIY